MKDIPIRTIQSPEPQPGSFDSFKIRSLSSVLAGKDMHQELHRHDFYFILAIRRGAGIHEIDFVTHHIVDHSIFILRPGQVHKLHLDAKSEGYLLEFTKDFQLLSSTTGMEMLRKVAGSNFSHLAQDHSEHVHALLASMLEEFISKEVKYEHAIKAALEYFLIHLIRTKQNHSEKANSARGENLYRQQKLQEFLDLLEVNVGSIKQVRAYAEKLALSAFQLNFITKTLLGKTAAELIDDQIILEAKRYLLATPNQVNQIADLLGYDDVSYFIRFFKKRTGYSPEAFRQNFPR